MKTKLCMKSGCGRAAIPGKNYCQKHIALEEQRKKVFTKRGKSSEYHNLYTSPRWRKESREFLRMYSTCCQCGKEAKICDHIQPHRGNLALFWDRSNWQPLCWSCHSRKTFKENNNFHRKGDGGVKT